MMFRLLLNEMTDQHIDEVMELYHKRKTVGTVLFTSRAGINHCLSIEQAADEWIEEFGIPKENYDNISECRYEVPTVTSIGRVYQKLSICIRILLKR